MTAASHARAPVRRRNPRGEGGRLRDDIIAAAELLAQTGDDHQLTPSDWGSPPLHLPPLPRPRPPEAGGGGAQLRPLRPGPRRRRPADHDPAQALLARCCAYCRFALANPGPYRFLFSHHAPTGDPGRPLIGLPAFRALAASIRRCQQAGLARAGDDPAWLAAQVWAALHGLVLLRMNAPGFPWPAPVEHMADQAVARLIQLDPPA